MGFAKKDLYLHDGNCKISKSSGRFIAKKNNGNHNADEPALPMLQAGRAGTKLKNLVSGFYESPGLKI
jgi:hypothetical protein